MTETLLPMVEDEWKKPPVRRSGHSVITELGVIEGEILTYLEEHGASTGRQVIHDLSEPAPLVLMALGGLVRTKLACVVQDELDALDIIVLPIVHASSTTEAS